MLHALFEICRRALWLLTVVLALSVVTFALAPPPTQSSSLPRFFNSKPKSLNNYAWTLAQSVAADDASSARSANELARLGALALPHVLPKLDSLPTDGRLRVLMALKPVAQRMGLTHASGNVAQLSGTWLSFLSENSVYLHPTMAKRLVARFVDDPSAQHTRDLRRLDTFAVPELVHALNDSAQRSSDTTRVRNLIELLRQITGHDETWSLPAVDGSTLRIDDAVLERWRGWWFAERHLYDAPTATSHLTAPLLQTQFALWVRGGAGAWLDRGLVSALRAIPWSALARSVSLFIVAVVGGSALTRLHERASGRKRVAGVVGDFLATFSWLPPALLALGAQQLGLSGMWIAVPLVALFGAALTLRRQRGKARAKATAMPRVTGSMYTATLLGVCLAVEWGLQVQGLGPIVVAAIRHSDATPVLCVALVNTLLIGVVQYTSSLHPEAPV